LSRFGGLETRGGRGKFKPGRRDLIPLPGSLLGQAATQPMRCPLKAPPPLLPCGHGWRCPLRRRRDSLEAKRHWRWCWMAV